MDTVEQASPQQGRNLKPPYPSYTSFRNYIKKLSETIIPSEIDRSVFGNQSGTYISLMIGAFEWFGLIDDTNTPTQKLRNLVAAFEGGYESELKGLLNDSYDILRDKKIDLKTGTEAQISKLFRDYGYSGSTLTKAISFFLSACKDAGYQVGEHLKAPAPPRNGPSKGKRGRPAKNSATQTESDQDNPKKSDPAPGMTVIPIGLHGMQDGAIHLPSNLSKKQWEYAVKMAKFILENYHQEFDDDEDQTTIEEEF
ncbi:DUF5343 domain-containing protein [Teredinibacter turnerae]|uniref:DUF5343 domain-containing protein n=1 Tax=Teredinibacter turnerae TaxID=2426 RepID=UPI0005F7C1C1|nr:DUF5343 domain-containing protein [Teredinibacter turnerae]